MSLVGYSLRSHKESDTIEQAHMHSNTRCHIKGMNHDPSKPFLALSFLFIKCWVRDRPAILSVQWCVRRNPLRVLMESIFLSDLKRKVSGVKVFLSPWLWSYLYMFEGAFVLFGKFPNNLRMMEKYGKNLGPWWHHWTVVPIQTHSPSDTFKSIEML